MLLATVLAGPTPVPPIPELDASNFSTFLSSQVKRTFVFFYSPHCGHCHAMRPAWENLARATQIIVLEDLLVPLPMLAAVDATANKALADGLQVNGYPTLLAFEPGGGAVYEYDGDRSVDSMLDFVTRRFHMLSDAKARKGYMGDNGELQQSRLDLLLRAPSEARQIMDQAAETSIVATAFLVLFFGLAGACSAILFGYSPFASSAAAQFIIVQCPEGIKPGDTFTVEIITKTKLPLEGLFLGKRRRRRLMDVQAPAGIQPGSSFFVPLVDPPAVRAVEPSAAVEQGATSANARAAPTRGKAKAKAA